MTIEPSPALIVAVVSLAAQGANFILMLKRKADASELIDRLDNRYVRRELFDAELKRIDERAAVVHRPQHA